MRLVWERGRVRLNFGQRGKVFRVVRTLSSNRTYGHFRRVPTGRVIFEIGGTPVREELARDGDDHTTTSL